MFLQMIKKIENQEKIDKDIILTDDYMNDEDLAHKASLYIWMTFRFELFTDIKGAKFIYDEAVKRLNKNLGWKKWQRIKFSAQIGYLMDVNLKKNLKAKGILNSF